MKTGAAFVAANLSLAASLASGRAARQTSQVARSHRRLPATQVAYSHLISLIVAAAAEERSVQMTLEAECCAGRH